MKIVIVHLGKEKSNLEHSYERTMLELGHEVIAFQMDDAIKQNISFNFLPAKISNYIYGQLESETTIKKANVSLTKFVIDQKPNVVFVFTNSPINPSTIVYLRTLNVKVILIYPDAIVNMSPRNSENVKFYDAIFSYSKSGVEAFKMLGAESVFWCPLAADTTIHLQDVPKYDYSFKYDISFIGNYRPERESVIESVIKAFPSLRYKIVGSWNESKSLEVKKHAETKHLYGLDYAKFINDSFLNLNIIDKTNYPAANMRFFEIPISGGLQLSSECPEMENTYIDMESVIYFRSQNELKDKIDFCFRNRDETFKIRHNANKLTKNEHTYVNRSHQIVDYLRSIS